MRAKIIILTPTPHFTSSNVQMTYLLLDVYGQSFFLAVLPFLTHILYYWMMILHLLINTLLPLHTSTPPIHLFFFPSLSLLKHLTNHLHPL
jgi:hypothetical protein